MSDHTPETIEARFTELAALEPGWLEGNGEKILPSAIFRAKVFIETTKATGFSIFPTEEGGISLEWLANGDTHVQTEFTAGGEDELFVLKIVKGEA